MADYYNRTTSPLPVSLLNGRSGCLPPKQWTTIKPEDEGSESIARSVANGDLLRRPTPSAPSAPVPVAAPESVPVVVEPPVVIESSTLVSASTSVTEPLQTPADGSMSATSSNRPARAKKE